MLCVACGIVTIPAKQGKTNVTPANNEANVDHVKRREDGGSGTPNNGDVRCFNCNVKVKN